MKFSSYKLVAVLMGAVSFTACQDDLESVENRVYDSGALKPTTVLVDGTFEESTQTFSVNLANPVTEDVNITYGVDLSLVDAYNKIFNAKAVALPEANYNIVEATATVPAGAVKSSNVEVAVVNLSALDRDIVYVLPLTVKSSTIPVLESEKTRFIVVRGAALINVVANITRNYCSLIDASKATGLNNLTKLTVQGMVNIDVLDKLISTIMGIEGDFLLRIGDAGVPADQLQLATSNGNVTDPSWTFATKRWQMFAFTYEASTGNATLWLDGNKKATLTSGKKSAVNWGNTQFFVGKSYDDNRWLEGCVAEFRIWNDVLPDSYLANIMNYYTCDPNSEGLVAYWKFNDEAGSHIKDYASGYDLTCNEAPDWVPVSLPN